ncbi:thioredoxin-disulfide reductase [Agathobaculum sp. NSJ-28]|uniref:Thioredoxin reductase n=2 Tax=Agathobaculum TaxID=2048137 RepID=A0A923LUQ3_9FIRM|nr:MULTISPECIES: thioredoxin-disulfide reductase [Butyricicoccaceae]MBS6881705.1 thioredoxin-disulfide reductase [Clostridiaceae bacterium]SCI57675.1 Thioredoxin reductase [uncultured Butyricicoccus sp.]MBC5724312.1 thioredoxin-disulfide reductase [Agathobaculum faecis]MCU6788044.1 thioredoxin-disulfide reductase [Agathobaculum ammoniilyticum]WOC75394.1 thioredoxin-disulfide reductase [Intestinibacillus sp. NTUH-41-i26]
MGKIYDMLVIGGGPGGYTAALYGARAGLSVLVIEKLSAGGQMATTEQVENYPGFDEPIDGFELGERMQRGAERFGAESLLATVTEASLEGPVKRVTTDEGVVEGRTVVLATGASPRPLGVPEEQALVGRGMAYCAACDGMFYKGRTVCVVGGGNTAVGDALLLAKLCEKVYLIHRRDTLRASKVYEKSLQAAENLEIVWDSRVTRLLHAERVTGVQVENVKTGAVRSIACDGVFAAVGRVPDTALLASQVALDEQGYLIADETTRTSVAGVFAVGDVRTKAVRQIVTAASDGAVAAHFAEEYLNSIT